MFYRLRFSLVIARRASTYGDVQFNCLQEDSDDWVTFTDVLWSCQYTARETKMNLDLRHCLADESQGNPAIAVAIYTGAQRRAITTGGTEKITLGMLKAVIREDYPRLLAPLEKLRQSKNGEFQTREDGREFEKAYDAHFRFKEEMDYKELGLTPPSRNPAEGSNPSRRRKNTSSLPHKGR
jgi:hypothetical protein